ncbi:MAG: 2-succinyl-5-enolpyruvyl-6-hydroxy-3-cyclohexene-1-carboxylic-acid synthase [Microbacterium sp.]
MRDSRHAAPATDAAAALLCRLVELGVHHFVVSPGARSQALALVAAELEARGVASVHVHVRIDERVAGFTALGIGRESRMPAAVICTSGTAVANLLPAALEAHHAGVPLILLTADRPPELRGVGANQTTRQPGIFAPNVRFEADLPVPGEIDPDGAREQSTFLRRIADEAVAAALGIGAGRSAGASAGAAAGPAGPVHLNLPYRDPLAGVLPDWLGERTAAPRAPAPGMALADDPPAGAEFAGAEPAEDVPAPEPSGVLAHGGRAGEANSQTDPDSTPHVLERGPRTIVVAGADAGPAAEALAYAGGWPLVAEIVSGARYGRNLVHGYRELLARPDLGGRVERAVVFGHPTLSREVAALLSREEVEVLAVRGPGESLDLNGATNAVDAVVAAAGEIDRDWFGAWMRASRQASVDLAPAAPDADGLASAVPRERLGAIAAELGVLRAPIDRKTLVDAVWRATWPHDRLVFGSSRLVRVADGVLGGKKVPVHANRGLAGIDGTIATAMGVALASQATGTPGVTRVLLGDLALLHDVGAMLLPRGETMPRLQVIVGNDGGGTIFDTLEVGSVAGPAAMDRVLYTPHAVEIANLAEAYGWRHARAATRAELDQALTAPVAGCQVVEVVLAR